MKVFITGTESFVGSELIKKCLAKKIDVYGYYLITPVNNKFHKFDINQKEISEIVPEEVDALIHLASLSDNKQCENNEYECFRVNVLGTINLMEAAMKRKAKQFI